MRNAGGAIGIAVVDTCLQSATRLHALRLSEALGASGVAAREAAAELTRGIARTVPDAQQRSLMADAILTRIVGRQALTLAFDDVFRMMSYLLIAALVMVPFCRPPKIAGPAPVEH